MPTCERRGMKEADDMNYTSRYNKNIYSDNVNIKIKQFLSTEFFLVSIFMLGLVNGLVAEILKFWDINAPTSLVYVIIYLMALTVWVKVLIQKPMYCLCAISFLLCFLAVTALFAPLNLNIIFNIGGGSPTEIAQSNFMKIMGLCLPLLIGTKICFDSERIKKYLLVYSRLIVLLFLGAMFLSIFVYSALSINYMTVAYAVLPALFFVYDYRKKYQKKIDLALIILGFIGLFFGGCRGAIITFAVFVFIYEIRYLKQRNGWWKFCLLMVLPLLILLISFNFIGIIKGINSILKSFGYQGRLLAKILGISADGDFFEISTRQEIIDILMPNIGIIGKGIFADQVILGVYAHNIVVQILLEFGLIFGPILIGAFIFYVFRKYMGAEKRKDEFGVFCVFALTAVICIKLMFSSTYLTDQTFWFFLGLVSWIKNKNNIAEKQL